MVLCIDLQTSVSIRCWGSMCSTLYAPSIPVRSLSPLTGLHPGEYVVSITARPSSPQASAREDCLHLYNSLIFLVCSPPTRTVMSLQGGSDP